MNISTSEPWTGIWALSFKKSIRSSWKCTKHRLLVPWLIGSINFSPNFIEISNKIWRYAAKLHTDRKTNSTPLKAEPPLSETMTSLIRVACFYSTCDCCALFLCCVGLNYNSRCSSFPFSWLLSRKLNVNLLSCASRYVVVFLSDGSCVTIHFPWRRLACLASLCDITTLRRRSYRGKAWL